MPTKAKPPANRKSKIHNRKSVKSLPNGRTAWKCGECRRHNDGAELSCLACDAVRTDLPDRAHMLMMALEPDKQSAKHWRNRRERGATDYDIEGAIHAALSWQRPHRVSTDKGTVCWVSGPVNATAGEIGIWFDRDSPPESNADPPADLTGQALIDAVRELYAIPRRPAARRKPKANGKKPQGDQVEPAPSASEQGLLLELSIDAIRVGGNNPRKHFDDGQLKRLTESVKATGILQPLLVRPIEPGADGRSFELIAGERRYRAAKAAGVKHVPAISRSLTDRQAAEVRLLENSLREDLNPIEEAEALARLTDDFGLTQRELAAEFGLSQGHISNGVRLLKLPAKWQKRVISGEITPAHCKHLLRWTDRPKVLAAIEQQMSYTWGTPSADRMPQIVRAALDRVSRPLSGQAYIRDNQRSRFVDVALTKKERQREDLDVVEIKGLGKRAFNVPLWEELQAAGEERRAQRLRKGTTKQHGEDVKAAAERAKKRKKQLAKRLWAYKVQWHQRAVRDAILALEPHVPNKADDQAKVLALVLYFTVNPSAHDDLADFARAAGLKVSARSFTTTRDSCWAMIVGHRAHQLLKLAKQAAAEWVMQPTESNYTGMTDDVALAMAKDLGVDLKKHWRLEREFLQLFDKDGLWQLVGEWDVSSHPAWLRDGKGREKRGELIDGLLAVADKKRLRPPKCLVEAKRPRMW